MPQVKRLAGTVYAESAAETFYGDGSFDTVSYLNAPSSATIGDYDTGVTVNLADPSLNTWWAVGDSYFGVERITEIAPNHRKSTHRLPLRKCSNQQLRWWRFT